MAGSSSNHRLTTRIITVLRKAYGRKHATTKRPALEELLLGIAQAGVTEAKAVAALNSLTRHFVDWNEVRVAQPHEIATAMGNLPDALPKAQVMRDALDQLCKRTNELSLDYLKEKSSREPLRLIAHIDGFPEFALARAMLNGLGENVFPLTSGVVSVCQRLGLLKEGADHDAMQRAIGRAVSKRSMFEVHWLLSRHAQATCLEKDPNCAECGLSNDCPTGKKILKAAAAEERRTNAITHRTTAKKATKKKVVKKKAAPKKAVPKKTLKKTTKKKTIKKKAAPQRVAKKPERKRKK